MYRTCLFCTADLGANEVIEPFPVGRRLAFDAAKGRLWVVCRRCERWNLTPMEERWEAIEACERAFQGTTLRVSTENIGLARVKEGLELVRIGSALRPEMAAWRYGDQFGRRQRRTWMIAAGGFVGAMALQVVGVKAGLLGGISYSTYFWSKEALEYWRRRALIHLTLADGRLLQLREVEVDAARIEPEGDDDWSLRLPMAPSRSLSAFKGKDEAILRGPDAIFVAGRILPRVNRSGAGRRGVQDSVTFLERAGNPLLLFDRVARDVRKSRATAMPASLLQSGALRLLPRYHRLALEMAANEDVERRALEGELHLLEAAWRDAEEVAKIADDMFLPAGLDERLEDLRKPR
ncbi:MAG TPA: hypothetical protein VGD77_15495 [Gemmatimonadaceae bacterium]